MGQRTNLLLQVEGRSGARLNRVYHLQWGYRKYLPMAFLRLLSSRYFKPQKTDIFEFFTRGLDLDSLDMIERDWNKYDFNQLDECQDARAIATTTMVRWWSSSLRMLGIITILNTSLASCWGQRIWKASHPSVAG